MAFYNERTAIPTKTSVNLVQDGPLLKSAGPEDVLASRSTIVREMEVEVTMDLAVAIEFHKWLGDRIAELQAAGVK